jgi:hypothetical protein
MWHIYIRAKLVEMTTKENIIFYQVIHVDENNESKWISKTNTHIQALIEKIIIIIIIYCLSQEAYYVIHELACWTKNAFACIILFIIHSSYSKTVFQVEEVFFFSLELA